MRSVHLHLIILALSGLVKAQTVQQFSFSFRDHDNHVMISWKTDDDSEIKQFNIYRSVDRENYYLVGEIPSKDKKFGSRYSHREHTASGGINYYRIVLIGKDGNTRIIEENSIEREDKEKAVYVYPNTEGGTLKVQSAEQLFELEVELTDLLGRSFKLMQLREGTHEFTVLTGPMERGFYILTCRINGKRYVKKKTVFT